MIDLNRKQKQMEEDTPIGAQILMLMPILTILFWAFVRAL